MVSSSNGWNTSPTSNISPALVACNRERDVRLMSACGQFRCPVLLPLLAGSCVSRPGANLIAIDCTSAHTCRLQFQRPVTQPQTGPTSLPGSGEIKRFHFASFFSHIPRKQHIRVAKFGKILHAHRVADSAPRWAPLLAGRSSPSVVTHCVTRFLLHLGFLDQSVPLEGHVSADAPFCSVPHCPKQSSSCRFHAEW